MHTDPIDTDDIWRDDARRHGVKLKYIDLKKELPDYVQNNPEKFKVYNNNPEDDDYNQSL